MRAVTSAARRLVLAGTAIAALAGCGTFDSDDSEPTATGSDTAIGPDLSVTIPATRLTPFCQAMIDLGTELETDPPADEGARIVEVYESIVDDVPAEIRDDFLAVLASLQTGEPVVTAAPSTASTAASTTAPTTAAPSGTATADDSGSDGSTPNSSVAPVEEGYSPDDSPALRLNLWIQTNCRSTQNNPGPAATQPGATAAP